MKRKNLIIYMLAVFAVSAAISLFVIFAANEAFAFDKAGGQAVIKLDDGNINELTESLRECGAVKFPLCFRAYAAVRGKTEFAGGEYQIDKGMSYDEIFLAVSGKKSRKQIKITIPEGARTSDIVKIFTDAGIGTESGFYAALDDDYGYDFIPEKPRDRTYRCDGYLFPDTYYFYLDSTERQVIAKMIENFNGKFSAKIRDAAAKHGLTADECVTLASIIQKEAFYTAEMGAISSVFHNRLHSKTLKRLESDATLAYAWSEYGGNGDYLDIDSPYNSYKSEGLPPGAICSPGLDALNAAANPKSTNYYYFFSKNDKTFVFSKTYSEHRAALKKFGVGTERTK